MPVSSKSPNTRDAAAVNRSLRRPSGSRAMPYSISAEGDRSGASAGHKREPRVSATIERMFDSTLFDDTDPAGLPPNRLADVITAAHRMESVLIARPMAAIAALLAHHDGMSP